MDPVSHYPEVAHSSRERNSVLLSRTSTSMRRLVGLAAAGALIAVPVGALAATASAEAPAPDATIQVQAAGDVDQQGADINRPHHKHRPGGPRHHRQDPGAAPQPFQQFQQLLPPTGSG